LEGDKSVELEEKEKEKEKETEKEGKKKKRIGFHDKRVCFNDFRYILDIFVGLYSIYNLCLNMFDSSQMLLKKTLQSIDCKIMHLIFNLRIHFDV
jgi:hypothetical protein